MESRTIPRSGVRLDVLEHGQIAVLTLDPSERENVVFDGPLLRDLDDRLAEVEELPRLEGLILTGRSPLEFCYGADVEALASVDDPSEAELVVRMGQEVFERLHRLGRRGGGPVRTVAAVGGAVPGGAFEISLACDAIVLARDPSTRIGLPEVKLGIVPGWGGSQRLPRRAGIITALEAITSGRLYRDRAALKLGLVDRLTWPGDLVRIATRIALGQEKLRGRRPAWKRWLVDRNPIVAGIVRTRATDTIEQKTGGHYPAPLAAVDLVLDAPNTELAAGLEKELKVAVHLLGSPVSRALVGIFRAGEESKRLGRRADGSKVPPPARVGVVGAGVMGAGIASQAARKGLEARVVDMQRAVLDRAAAAHRALVAKSRVPSAEKRAAIDRFETGVGSVGLGRCDAVIEAVPENLDLKRKVLGDLETRVAADCLLCTNTSTLPVEQMAEGLAHPERLVGLHFFNPVDRMPLVEIIPAASTSDETVARACALALKLGKTPVIVADRPGFLVNRLLAPYLDEALQLVDEGISPRALDRVAKEFGLPMGPLELLDTVGLDVAAHSAASLFEAFGPRVARPGRLDALVGAGELGGKSGRGIYVQVGKHRRVNPRLGERAAAAGTELNADKQLVLDRLLLPMVTEAQRCLEEGVVRSGTELDLATVYGTGFPPFRGGLWTWMTRLADLDARLERCRTAAGTERGERFTRGDRS